MWQSVAAYCATFFESTFALHRQRQLTLGVLVLILLIGIFLLATIAWADLFYA
jgi:hypothetical protein